MQETPLTPAYNPPFLTQAHDQDKIGLEFLIYIAAIYFIHLQLLKMLTFVLSLQEKRLRLVMSYAHISVRFIGKFH